MPDKVIFLDRDGTINVDTGAVYDLADWQFVDGAIEGLKILANLGYTLTVVTNQAAVARGGTTVEKVEALHRHMRERLAEHGVEIAAIAYCPHARDAGCDCRKPAPGMYRKIVDEIGPVDAGQSWMVGDKESDVGFGRNAGLKTALIRSRYWNGAEQITQPTLIVSSLLEFAHHLHKQAGA